MVRTLEGAHNIAGQRDSVKGWVVELVGMAKVEPARHLDGKDTGGSR